MHYRAEGISLCELFLLEWKEAGIQHFGLAAVGPAGFQRGCEQAGILQGEVWAASNITDGINDGEHNKTSLGETSFLDPRAQFVLKCADIFAFT